MLPEYTTRKKKRTNNKTFKTVREESRGQKLPPTNRPPPKICRTVKSIENQ